MGAVCINCITSASTPFSKKITVSPFTGRHRAFLLRCDFSGGVVKCILQGCEHLFFLAVNAALLDTTPLITHPFPLSEIQEAYCIFENRLDGVIKAAITAHPSKT